jgi:hypothetical protein
VIDMLVGPSRIAGYGRRCVVNPWLYWLEYA